MDAYATEVSSVGAAFGPGCRCNPPSPFGDYNTVSSVRCQDVRRLSRRRHGGRLPLRFVDARTSSSPDIFTLMPSARSRSSSARRMIDQSRHSVAQAVNASLSLLYWHLGKELHGFRGSSTSGGVFLRTIWRCPCSTLPILIVGSPAGRPAPVPGVRCQRPARRSV